MNINYFIMGFGFVSEAACQTTTSPTSAIRHMADIGDVINLDV
jgi:hypothetical protein